MIRQQLIERIEASERWLLQRVLQYARAQEYTRYTSTLEEAWRLSIAGLSASLTGAIRSWEAPRETSPDEEHERDPAAAFGILEARRHRERGVSFAMFLGLMKYYRRAYLDLCGELGWPPARTEVARAYVDRFFDRMELGFCSEWVALPDGKQLAEMQDANRRIVNEKNRYLTLFESAASPMFLFDDRGRPCALNHAAAQLLARAAIPGSAYYDEEKPPFGLPWLQREVARLAEAGGSEAHSETDIETPDGPRRYDVRLKAMLDVSGKFTGTTAVLFDLTALRRAERQLLASREQLRALVARLNSVREEEKARLSRELHDEMGQLLTALRMELEVLEDRLGDPAVAPGDRELLDHAVAASELVAKTIQSMRTILSSLNPVALDRLGLEAALRQECRRFQEWAGVACELDATRVSTVGVEADTALFRIAQEALTNVARHSGASRVAVSLARKAGKAVLRVEDNGRGIAAGHESAGLGVLGMRERAERLGGELRVEAMPGGGTAVEARIPLRGARRT